MPLPPNAAPVDRVMRRLGSAIRSMELPAIEKLQEDNASTPFQTLVATMLSAQTRDEVTHAASLRLFAVAPTPRQLAALPEDEIRKLIYPVSFYRNKARHVRETARQIATRLRGRVPTTMEALLALPGVGRKTANLVLILGFKSLRNICVDTHVHRISNRLGWVKTNVPDETEQALYERIAPRWWPYLNLYLVTWGQHTCRPTHPRCGECVIAERCARAGVTRISRKR
jgi:endonuclease-3